MCVSIYSENINRDESKIKWFIETLARLVEPKKQNKTEKVWLNMMYKVFLKFKTALFPH